MNSYQATDWVDHDRVNQSWIADTTRRLDPLLPTVIERLEEVYEVDLPNDPVPVCTVVVGRTGPAYTNSSPPLITCSTTHRKAQGEAAVEIVLHEMSHVLAQVLYTAIDERTDDHDHPQLWHVMLFYLTGEVVRRCWAEQGVEYLPYLDATALFDRAWPELRAPVTAACDGYLNGDWDLAGACDRVVDATRSTHS